jgi:hypothetical protein
MMNKRKTKRFRVGGMSDEDVASFAGTPENDSNAGMAMKAGMMEEAGMMEKEPDENFKSTPKAKAKAPMVTKEELAKSGLSLRDYMNKQQGLTRRGDSAPAKMAAPAKVETEVKPKLQYQSLQDRAKSYADERAKSGVGMYGSRKSEPTSSEKTNKATPDLSVLQAPAKSEGMTAMAANMARRKMDQNKDTSYKSGGSVSSASKRADGIASKGKTKGRMV